MRRLFFWSTLAAGVTAAYLMRKRGASFGHIARNTILNPVGSFVSEVRGTR